MQAAGLLDGLELDFTTLISREEAMQVFANLLVGKGSALPDEAETDELLSSISDQETITPEYRAAVALCMQKGLVKGYADGTLQPAGNFTRAEFAKLLTML